MTDLSFHLAPNAPWLILLGLSVIALLLGRWAYGFAVPPIPALVRRAFMALRFVALALLLWLLAQPVLERAQGGRPHVVVLLDRSRSMELPATTGGERRARVAERAVAEIGRALGGRASVEVRAFAAGLAPDSAAVPRRDATALGDALEALAASPAGERAGGVVVVSDGAINAGDDPVAAARALGLPVHAVVVGEPAGLDRALAGIDASVSARAGEITPVRVRVSSSEARGTPIGVSLRDGDRELARSTVVAPGDGAEVTAEFRVTPTRPGLAVWTARVDSAGGEITTANNARQVAIEVAPGRIGVLVLTGGLNWDLTFLRRALLGDSSLAVTTWTRDRGGWRALEDSGGVAPAPSDLRASAVVVLDAVSPASLGAEFDAALASFVRGGGGLLLLGGPPPSLARYAGGSLAADLTLRFDPSAAGHGGMPAPTPEARDLLAWDDDMARGEMAWRAAAPLSDLAPIVPAAGDRVLIGTAGGGPPLMMSRRIGRGQALLVNGTGLWRWSLAPGDELAAERGRRLWRRIARWLAEPVQGEPLRVRPERWLAAAGEPVRLFATLQDEAFRPVAGAEVEAEVTAGGGAARRVRFEPGQAGSYAATLDDLPPGRYRVSARAARSGRELGRASTELAVDRWSLEEARTLPDSATLAAVAQASGGRVATAAHVARWARTLPARALARGRSESLRLWESPWVFAVVVGALGLEWLGRRRRGLP
ncbi:MAG TPA: hypothetical protein VGK89_04105 [Candidatus Eisenbacteria bacterium]